MVSYLERYFIDFRKTLILNLSFVLIAVRPMTELIEETREDLHQNLGESLKKNPHVREENFLETNQDKSQKDQDRLITQIFKE